MKMMLSGLSKSQKAIVEAVKAFAKGEFDKDHMLELDKTAQFSRTIWEKAAELGFVGIHLPEEFDGGGMQATDHVLVAETFSALDSTMGAAIMLSGIGAEWLAMFGGEALQRKYLSGTLTGKILAGAAIPKADSSFTVLETPSPATLRISGEADGVINGGLADVYFISTGDGFVVIDSDRDGIEVEKRYQPLGLRMTPSARMRFTDVEIPEECRVVIKQKSRFKLLTSLRMLLSALAVGTAQGALDRALDYAKQRRQFGRKLSDFQVLRHKLARMEVRLCQARYLTLAAAADCASKNPDEKLTAMACLASGYAAVEIAYEAIQLFGGYGYTVEYEVERCYRDAKTIQLLGGAGPILNDEIAQDLIGRTRG
jgi:alkylation response protein AidB-like acyl-CoA dehydrogenase